MGHQLKIKIDNPVHPEHDRYRRAVDRCTVVILGGLLYGLFSLVCNLWVAALAPIFLLAAVILGCMCAILVVAVMLMALDAFWQFLMGH